MNALKKQKLLVAGGGTGGHVLAGISIADEWKKLYGESGEILFVGASQGLESKLVPRHGYRLVLLKIGALNQVSVKTRLITLVLLPLSFLKALFVLLMFRPKAVIGVGGYASGPVVLLARFLSPIFSIKTAILEQNSVAGFTNRVLGKWVHRVYCAFEESQKTFEPQKVLFTGNPIRSHLKQLPQSIQDPFTLFIFGGSQGAMGMNTLVLDALPFLKDQGIHFIHQTGVKDFERVAQAYQRAGILNHVRIEKFIEDMGACYAQSSLVICRAGASTMAELASVGRAAIFVPLPTAADNHQEKNSSLFQKAQAAWVVPQGKMTGSQFAAMILDLKNKPGLIHETENRVKQFYQSQAAEKIVSDLGAP